MITYTFAGVVVYLIVLYGYLVYLLREPIRQHPIGMSFIVIPILPIAVITSYYLMRKFGLKSGQEKKL